MDEIDQVPIQLWRNAQDEVERLSRALQKCSDVAVGDFLSAPSDRCAAIVIHVDTTFNGEAAKAGGDDE